MKCYNCGTEYSTIGTFKRHPCFYKAIHTCTICEITFSRFDAAQRHNKRVHSTIADADSSINMNSEQQSPTTDEMEFTVADIENQMLAHKSERIKSQCLKIYKFLSEIGQDAQKEIEILNGETTYNNIIDKCFATLSFTNGIIQQLTDFLKDIKTDINETKPSETDEIKNELPKKESALKRSKFSLKKEKDEEYTQDEFLQIYKIDMTEDLGAPDTRLKENDTQLSDKLNDSDDKSSLDDDQDNDNGSISTVNLLDDTNEVDELNENDILNNIGLDSTDGENDSDDSLFSCTTLLIGSSSQILSDSNELNEEDDDKIPENTENDDDETSKTNADIVEGNREVKECSVILSDCEKRRSSQEGDKEMRSIENLVNLDNLNRKRKLEASIESAERKKQKQDKKGNNNSGNSTEENTDSSVTDCEIDPRQLSKFDKEKIEDDKTVKSGLDFMKLLVECISDLSDFFEDGPNSSSEGDINENKKELTPAKVISKDTENGIATDQFSEDLMESNSAAEEKRQRKKWRQDKLLTEKLTDGSSDDEKENDPEQRKRPRRLRRIRRKKCEKEDVNAKRIISSSEADHSSDSDFDNLSIENLTFSSDTSLSDVESLKGLPKADCEENQSEDDPKLGRRNIRTVKSDLLLTETTKKAQKEEEERRERLLSQTQLLSQIAEEEGLVLDVDKKTKEPLIVVDPYITHYLKTHQKEGIRFMWNSCYENSETMKNSPGSGCILAHCMGLGKSFQVISLIHTLFSYEITNTKHVIIVCPLSTVLNWEKEFKLCARIVGKNFKINRYLITDGKLKRERHKLVIDWYRNKGVLILAYDSFKSILKTSDNCKVNSVPKKVVEALLDPGPDLVICDEGHLIKNGALNRAKTLVKIKTKRRIILTGTPMQNNLTEYYYMVDFVKPNLLGTKKEFCNRFTNPIVNGSYDNSTDTDIKLMRNRSHVLHEYLKETIQRYEMSELKQYLPDKLDYVLFIQLSPLQIELYKACLEILHSTEIDRKKYFFPDYMKLRDIWTHPCILRLKEQNKLSHQNKRKEVDTIPVEPDIQEEMPNEWWHSKCPEDLLTNIKYGPKMNVMLEIIEYSVRLNDKLLIFGSHLAELDAIEYFLQGNGWKKNDSYLRMDGTVPPNTRMAYCNKFNDPNQKRLKLFLLSHQVGGLGLNLVAANRIILMDVNFNPSHDSQSIFRTYRFGQQKRCYVYRLVSIGTMEEVIYERSITKLSVSLRVVDEHQISRHYKSNDLQKMYRFNVYTDEERPVVKLPVDEVLAAILEKCKKEIFKYHEHQNLLENRPEEQLNPEEQKLAWDEFRKEQEAAYQHEIAANNAKLAIAQNPQINQPSTCTITTSESVLVQPPTTTLARTTPDVVYVNSLPSNVSSAIRLVNSRNVVPPVRTSQPHRYPFVRLVNGTNSARSSVGAANIRTQLINTVPVGAGANARPQAINIAANGVSNVRPHLINVIRGANMQNFGRQQAYTGRKRPPPPYQPRFPVNNNPRPRFTNSQNAVSVTSNPSNPGVINFNEILERHHQRGASNSSDEFTSQMTQPRTGNVAPILVDLVEQNETNTVIELD